MSGDRDCDYCDDVSGRSLSCDGVRSVRRRSCLRDGDGDGVSSDDDAQCCAACVCVCVCVFERLEVYYNIQC